MGNQQAHFLPDIYLQSQVEKITDNIPSYQTASDQLYIIGTVYIQAEKNNISKELVYDIEKRQFATARKHVIEFRANSDR